MALARASRLSLKETSFDSLAIFGTARIRTVQPAVVRLRLRTQSTRHFQSSTDTEKPPPYRKSRAPKPDRSASKLFKDADEAVKDLQSDSVVFSAGFGLSGTAGW